MFCTGGRRDMQDLAAQGRERQAPLRGPGCQGQVLDLLPEQRQSNACGTRGPLWLWGCASQGGQWQMTLRVSYAAQRRAGLAPCGPLWCWTWFSNSFNPLNIFLYGDEESVGSSNGTKASKEAPAVRSTFSCVVGVSQPFTVVVFMGSLKSLSCANIVGDTGDKHFVLESDFWVARRAHTVSPFRGRRLHDTRGPRDAVPH